MISVMSSVGSPTDVSTMTMVTSPAWGMPAAPMLAAVAVMLEGKQSTSLSRRKNTSSHICRSIRKRLSTFSTNHLGSLSAPSQRRKVTQRRKVGHQTEPGTSCQHQPHQSAHSSSAQGLAPNWECNKVSGGSRRHGTQALLASIPESLPFLSIQRNLKLRQANKTGLPKGWLWDPSQTP